MNRIGKDQRDAIQLKISVLADADEAQDAAAEKLIAAENLPENKIVVQGLIEGFHVLTSETRDSLKIPRRANFKTKPSGKRALDIRVGAENLTRALRVFDALLKAFDARGIKVECTRDKETNRWWTWVEVVEEQIPIALVELNTKAETSGNERQSTVVRALSGRLGLRILERSGVNLRKTWVDRKNLILERQLNRFVIGLYRTAVAKRAGDYAMERFSREMKEIGRRKKEAFERTYGPWKEAEKERLAIIQLLKQADSFSKSTKIRMLIQAVRDVQQIPPNAPSVEGATSEWLAWAEKVADRFDPTKTNDLYDESKQMPKPNPWEFGLSTFPD